MFWPFSSRSQHQRQPGLNASHSGEVVRNTRTVDDDTSQNNDGPSTQRVFFGRGSTTVYGHPSYGGLLVLSYCNGVDLNFLGLSRFETAERSEDTVAENRHCHRMRKLGAWSFKSVSDYEDMRWLDPQKLNRMKLTIAAWPESGPGVWVITNRVNESVRSRLGCLWNAFSMNERCEEVQKLGGSFYEDPTECPDLDLE